MELVNKNSPMPCYYQVYMHLKGSIENQTYASGQQLPSERELSEQFHVNRFTVRRAVENLIGDGLVYPIRRKGYFVKTKDIDIQIHKKTSYTQCMLSMNLPPKVEILEMKTAEPSNELALFFDIQKSDKIWILSFLRYYNNLPYAISNCHLSYDRMPDLNLMLKENHSLYQVLNKYYSIIPTRVESICEACQAGKKESKYLSILGDAPLLKVTSNAVDQNGRYVERAITKFRSDMVKIRVDFQNI